MKEESKENKKSIFIIDDSEMDIMILKHYLERYEFRNTIFSFKLAQQAIENIKENCIQNKFKNIPFLIFLDINIDDISDFDFLYRLNLLCKEIADKINIIIITSSEELNDLKRAKAYPNVYSYIIKPINMPTTFWDNLKKL